MASKKLTILTALFSELKPFLKDFVNKVKVSISRKPTHDAATIPTAVVPTVDTKTMYPISPENKNDPAKQIVEFNLLIKFETSQHYF